MKPPIIIASQSLACGCIIANSIARTLAEKNAPHLIIVGSSPPHPAQTLPEILNKILTIHAPTICVEPFLKKQSVYQRATTTQPWYAKCQKRRKK